MKLNDLVLGDAAFSESVKVLRMVFADLNDLDLIKKAFEIAEKQVVDEELGKLAITQSQKPELTTPEVLQALYSLSEGMGLNRHWVVITDEDNCGSLGLGFFCYKGRLSSDELDEISNGLERFFGKNAHRIGVISE